MKKQSTNQDVPVNDNNEDNEFVVGTVGPNRIIRPLDRRDK